MPEIAECALFAQDANREIGDRKLLAVSIHTADQWSRTIVPREVEELLSMAAGSTVRWNSFGKALVCKLLPGYLVFRLGMTGRIVGQVPEGHEKHCFLTLVFEDNRMVHYVDFRRFGRIQANAEIPQGAIGGYRDGFWCLTDEKIHELAARWSIKSQPRHSLLLKTGVETGVGNYLALESLGHLDLSPFEPFRDREEFAHALIECGKIARKAFELGGNSFAGGYVRFDGSYGEYSKHCKFYKNPELPRTVFKGRPVYSRFQPV